MAKRVVQECDLTKQEYDPAETVTLVIKRSGKKTGRTYELSAEAAEKLETQLVSGKKLDNEWVFQSVGVTPEGRPKPRTVGELVDEDETFVKQKKQELQSEGVDLEPRELEEGQATVLHEMAQASDSNCLHLNKSGVQVTLRNGVRSFYRLCKECRQRIPEKTKAERDDYMGSKAPTGSRVEYKDGNSDE